MGALVACLLIARAYDRFPGHAVLAVVLVAQAASLALAPVTPVFVLLLVIFACIGAAMGAIDVGGNTLLVWTHRSGAAPFMNALHFAFGVGAFIAPIIIARTPSIDWGYWVLALAIVPIAVGLAITPSPAPQRESDGGEPSRSAPLVVGLTILFFFIYVGAESKFGQLIHSYAVLRGIADDETAAYLTSLFWGALTAGRLLTIPLAARITPQRLISFNLAGTVAGLLFILVLSDSLWALAAGTFIVGFSMSSIFPATMSLSQNAGIASGKNIGLFLVGANAGAMTLPWIAGQLIERIGVGVFAPLFLIFSAAGITVFIFLCRAIRTIGR